MSDDYQFDDESCPECGAYPTHWRDCDAIGCDDGEIDLYEYDDPINFDPGDTEPCRECFGTGILHWCPKCGFDFQDPRNHMMVEEARTKAERIEEEVQNDITEMALEDMRSDDQSGAESADGEG